MKKILIDAIKKYKLSCIMEIVLIGINMYFLTFPPKIVGQIIDLLYDINGNKEKIMTYVFYLIGVVILLLFIRTPWRYLSMYTNRNVEKELKNKLFDHMMKMKMENLQKIKNGELMSYFVKDINEIRIAMYRLMSYGSRIVFTLIIVTGTMIRGVDFKLTIVTMLPILFTSYLVVKIKKYVERSFQKSQKYFTELSEYVQESTDAIRTTKAYSQEKYQFKEFIKKNRKLRSSNNAVDVHSTLLSTCINICFGLCYGISLLYGSKLVIEGAITVGDFVAFNGYIRLFVGPVSWLPGLISRVKRAQIAYYRLEKVFDLEKEKFFKTDKEVFNQGDKLKGNIEIRDLTFNYPDSIDMVLEDVNLKIKQGEMLGIIGTIGSGKTTLMNLLIRLYRVPRGKIFIDGIDINDIPLMSLRNSICYITQDNFLFSTSLKENISLFKEEFKREEIEDSTKGAMIHDDIEKMENGIDTVIGERGTDLSGGQKQRVVISRAFLNKSNIVIFDDTFSALDNKTEESLLKNIRGLVEGKTCIIISNRISDIKNADNIIVLDHGNIVESGTHEELIDSNGIYQLFYQQQSMQEEAGEICEN